MIEGVPGRPLPTEGVIGAEPLIVFVAKVTKSFMGNIMTEVQTIALGALADQAAIKFSSLTLTEDFRILKSEIVAGIVSLDDDEAIQGLLFGICNGELSVAEIAAAITAGGPLDRNDRANAEEASRWVKVLSAAEYHNVGHNSGRTVVDARFPNETGGPVIVSKDRWTYSDPEGWNFFVFNNTGSVLITGATGRLTAKHYGVWV